MENEPVPEEVAQFPDLFALNTVWNIEQHIGDLKKKLKVDLRNYDEDYIKVADTESIADLELLKRVHDKVTNGIRVSLDFKTILKYSLVSKLLEPDIIDKNYYALILEVAKKLTVVENFRLGAFCDVVISKILNLNDTNPIYLDMIESFRFIKSLSDIVEPVYSMKKELFDLVAPIKLYLLKMMKDRDPENVKAIIKLILMAEEHLADLKIFKKSYELDVTTWIKWGKLPADFDYSGFGQSPVLKKFEEFPEEVQDILIDDFPEDKLEEGKELEPAEKIVPIYMTHQEAVEVSVWQARRANGDLIALKEVIAPNQGLLDGYRNEDMILKLLSGKLRNFLKHYGSELKSVNIGENTKYVLTIHMEYIDMTLKKDKLNRDVKNQPYNDHEIINIYRQLAIAFNTLRDLGILHCDIKPSNIMITKDHVIKIIDFNASKRGIEEMTYQTTAVGTKDFMSPEMRKGLSTNTFGAMKEDKSDVYSLGMTILYLVTDKPLIDLNLQEKQASLQEIIDSIKYEWLKPVLRKMLEFDYTQRPGLKGLISHFGNDLSVTHDT